MKLHGHVTAARSIERLELERHGDPMRNWFDIPYSFVCPNVTCQRQFEETLVWLTSRDRVPCPVCRSFIDIRESKRTGDLSQIFRDVHSFEKSRSKP